MANFKLEEAKRALKIADHMIYVTYPVLKENRLLIKIFEEIGKALEIVMDTILQNEYANKRAKIYSDPEINFDTFSKCSLRYNVSPQQVIEIKHLLGIIERHKKSAMEFTRKDRFVILSENLQTEIINLEKLKSSLNLAKEAVKKTENALTFS